MQPMRILVVSDLHGDLDCKTWAAFGWQRLAASGPREGRAQVINFGATPEGSIVIVNFDKKQSPTPVWAQSPCGRACVSIFEVRRHVSRNRRSTNGVRASRLL